MAPTKDPECHFAAAAVAAVFNFPLWRASAIAQSGFQVPGKTALERYYKAALQPPFRGTLATVGGMTWARATIFYGSEYGKNFLKKYGFGGVISSIVPPLVVSTFVQIVNMPLIRSTITLQNPSCQFQSVGASMYHLYSTKGLASLWHGTSAGIMKTVPKYITAIVVKDFMEEILPQVDKTDRQATILRSALKSVTAAVAGAALTNPFDVLRNEMFKTDLSVVETYRKLREETG